MFEHWGALEADFQREYGIDLSREIHRLSYRRFVALRNNLSGNSLYVLNVQHLMEPAGPVQREWPGITDPEETESAFMGWGA